jgi:EAL domain-containing protein (putative c-di-GMP-specific phosphodiesterase class I)
MSASACSPASEPDAPVLRARRTAALTRMAVGAAGIVLALTEPTLTSSPAAAVCGFAFIGLTSLLQLAAPRARLLSAEESLSGSSAVLIVGLGYEHVTVLSILWLTAIASGVLARGGRQHWLGRSIVLVGLLAPVVRYGHLNGEYAALCVATLGMLLTSGRLTQELNQLLMQARAQAESANTLLLAGDIAARMAERDGRAPDEPRDALAAQPEPFSADEIASARAAIARLIDGDGLTMVVQPIVDISSGFVHAYEALARFSQPGIDGGPLHWFALADELGQRPALERACLRAALELFARRPPGTSLSLNLSAPVLLEAHTQAMLDGAAEGRSNGLDGLIVEITEETLVRSDAALLDAFSFLRARGASLAVDDMGAGYSGLRQITEVHPRYLKLDRSLVSGIDGDAERAALVGALAGYSRQVGCLLVVEGVETDAELSTVRAIGAPLVQGFLLGRPAPPWPLLQGLTGAGEGVSSAAATERPVLDGPSAGGSDVGASPAGAPASPALPVISRATRMSASTAGRKPRVRQASDTKAGSAS